MRIVVTKKDGTFKQQGWYIKENDTGFWVYLSPSHTVPFKFPWTTYAYSPMEEK